MPNNWYRKYRCPVPLALYGANPQGKIFMEFEWDERKAAGNLTKHGVSFHESATVFGDPLAMTYFDPDHSEDEDRFLTFGHSDANLVSHTDRGDRIRIISARRATRRERKAYEEGARDS